MIVFVTERNSNGFVITGIRHLPPSVKLVYHVLQESGRITQKDLIRETSLPERTVRYALNRLRDEELLEMRHSFADARQVLYSIPVRANPGT